ncbi:unnamed protein product [Nippostrongylus brasiliensis]|uniref:MARVEL domain-containing protein n=1 Tax=Nippostrongylus brasiliensis TaxID=27835 RepID=A0A0N4YQZ9_NIPBR|nr:unnamed protein product [Nippostrongylus brasiliensis]
MRILSAFFAVLFTFINPCMLYKVVSELESSLVHSLPVRMKFRVFDFIVAYVANNNLTATIRLVVYTSVLLLTVLHLILTALSLYGHYSSRPAFIRPFLVDAAFSLMVLLLFVSFSALVYWHMSFSGVEEEIEVARRHLRNVYVGTAFLVSYLVWTAVSVYAYIDTKKLHADFMYWIVEEKMSMRSKANHSSDIRSERSSKASKASRTSMRSCCSDQPRLVSTKSETIVSSKYTVNPRLSVPL